MPYTGAASRGPTPEIHGAFITGTALCGHWVVWHPGNSLTDPSGWFVKKSPSSGLDWASGAYMPAGVVYNNGYDPKYSGDVVTIICGGFAPKGYVNDPGGNILGDGYPLILGGGEGVAAPMTLGDAELNVGCALEDAYAAETDLTVRCIVRNLQ